jgi:hypothetical protein
MLIPFSSEWRAARDRERRLAQFLAEARREPDERDVRWLADAATNGDLDHARWELRYARWALAALTAQHDALDDRTGSEVAFGLARSLHGDPRIAEGMEELAERQMNDRLSGYREAMIARGGPVGTGERLGRVLLAFASDGARSAGAPLARAVELLSAYLAECNAALRAAFGTPALPEHIPPSEAVPGRLP